MDGYRLTEDKIAGFEEHLRGEEHEVATVEKYLRNVLQIGFFLVHYYERV